MNQTKRTDLFIELLNNHDTLRYKYCTGTYAAKQAAFEGPIYYMFSNFFRTNFDLLKTAQEIRSFIAYAWYLRMMKHSENCSIVSRTDHSAEHLYVHDFLHVLEIPFRRRDTTILLKETFDIERLKKYKRTKISKV